MGNVIPLYRIKFCTHKNLAEESIKENALIVQKQIKLVMLFLII